MRERMPGVWELRVYCGRDPLTGKHVSISRSVKGGKRHAERGLNALLTEVEAAREKGISAAAPRSVTTSQLMAKHLETFKGSDTTLRSYRLTVELYIDPTLGRHPIIKVGPMMIDRLYEHLAQERGLGDPTIRKVHAVLRGGFAKAVKWGWLERNPVVHATAPTAGKPEMHLPSAAQVSAAIADADQTDPSFGMFVRTAAATGARRGELCALLWSNIDLDAGTVRIETSVYAAEGGGAVVKDTKNHTKRDIALDPVTTAALTEHHRSMVDRADSLGMPFHPEAFVFSDSADSADPWLPDRASHAWDRLRKRTGLDGVRLHDLRHFQATMLLVAGVPVANVSKRIGHRDTATTLNVYSQFVEDVDRHAATIMGNLLPPGRVRRTTDSPAPAPDPESESPE